MTLEIRDDYHPWIDEPTRKRSPELDFGVWWMLYPDNQPLQAIAAIIGSEPVTIMTAGMNSRWRVSWIDDTGELYARDQSPESNKFILIGHFPTEEAIEARMKGWAEGGAKALTDFFAREFVQGVDLPRTP